MNETERRGILWCVIERLAFRPSASDRDGWLWIYIRTLPKFWGLGETDIQLRRNTGFDADFIQVSCDYTVDAHDKYSVTIANTASPPSTCWHLHVDPTYCSKAALCDSTGSYPRQDIAPHLERDLESVLEGMLFHPRNHAHGSDIGIVANLIGSGTHSLETSEIRLGGGIENAYVFLMHMRYQFCIFSEKARRDERTRLTRLFSTAFQPGGQAHIPPARLFNFGA